MTDADELELWAGMSRGQALAGGLRDRDLAAMIKRGGWSRIRRGDYGLTPGACWPEDRHLLLVRSTIPRLGHGGRPRILSHASATVFHGLPVWNADLTRVHVNRPGSAGLARTGVIHPHRAQLAEDEVVMIDGVLVTSVARTILDLSRAYGFESGVVTADAALRTKQVTAEELAVVVERAQSRKAAGIAPHVVAFADGLAESVGESRSRVMFARVGLPRPVLQREIHANSGRLIGRVDFDIERFRTVGEFDGLRKYCRDLRPGERPEDAVVREKLREDEIRETDRQMVRWIWREIASPEVVLGRFQRAFARAGFPDWTPCPRLPWQTGTGRSA
jgi:hypothetical protein